MKWCSSWGNWSVRDQLLVASPSHWESEDSDWEELARGVELNSMVGVLVHGDNHFIVRGPLPDRDTALALVRQWSVIQIEAVTPVALDRWRISTREFRENLTWAVVVPGDGDISPAVAQLLDELSSRGIVIHNSGLDIW